MKSIIKRIVGVGTFGLVAFLSSQANAAGYKLEFQSPSVLADGGDAAVVEDAGTNWYNSAGLVFLPRQIAFSNINLYENTHFHGRVFAPSPFGLSDFNRRGTVSSHTDCNVPAYHVGFPLSPCWALGFSLVPTWGLMENYGENSFARYNLTRIYTRTLDLSPSIAWRINRWFSVGGGPDFDYWTVQQKQHVRTQPITLNDSRQRISAQSWAYGAHIGFLFRYDECTRFGLNWRSRITHNLHGYSDFDLRDIAAFETHRFSVVIPHPATTSFSFYRDMTPCWAMMGTITYDQWRMIQNLHGRRFIQPPSPGNPSGLIQITIPQNYHNTFDLSIGTHYRPSCNWLLRASIKYEQTPVSTKRRDINFPDGEKLGFNFGARYQMTKCVALDFIYAHVFTNKVNIHLTAPVTEVHTSGHSTTRIDLAGAQLVWDL